MVVNNNGEGNILNHFSPPPVVVDDQVIAAHPIPVGPDNSIPFYSISFSNLNCASTQEGSSSIRKSRLRANFDTLRKKFDINCYADTRLHPNNARAFKTYNVKGDIIYNNLSDRDYATKKAGGTLISLSPYIKNNCTYVDYRKKLPIFCHGFVQIIEFAHKNNTRLPFRVIVLYLPTGKNYNSRRSRILNAIMDLMRDCTLMHNYCVGDMNFVESDIDTSSRQGKHKISKTDYSVWTDFLRMFNLVERHQPGHTYYSIPKKDVSSTRSSRTDRAYTSHTEVECALFSPKAFIPSLPYNILNVYRDSLRHKQVGRNISKVGGKDTPDHLPVGVMFINTARSKKRSFNLPSWLASHPGYLEEVERQWDRRSKRVNMHNANSFAKAALFKKTITYTATKFLSNNSIKNKNDKISLLSLCISLIRLCTVTKPDIPKIKLFIDNHDYLSDFVVIKDNKIDHSDLTNKLNSLLKNALPFNIHDFDKDVRDLSGFSSPAASAEVALPNNVGNPARVHPNVIPDHSSESIPLNVGNPYGLDHILPPDHSEDSSPPNAGDPIHGSDPNEGNPNGLDPILFPDHSAELPPPNVGDPNGLDHILNPDHSEELPPPNVGDPNGPDHIINPNVSAENIPPPGAPRIPASEPAAGPSSRSDFLHQLKMELPSSRKLLLHLQSGEDEDPTSDPTRMGHIIKDFWQEIWYEREGNCKPSSPSLDAYFDKYDKHIEPTLTPVTPNKTLVRSTILDTNNSCAGPDGIPFIIYRKLINISTDIIHDTLTDLGNNIPPPEDFNLARLFIIPKSSSPLISKTRPISVTNADNRIIAKCVSRAITPCLQSFLDEAQQGFTKGRKGSTHLINIHDFFHNMDENKQRFLFFMDTKKAFDSIDHDFIHKILSHIGMPPWVCKTVSSLMCDVRVIPVLNMKVDISIDINRGVKQGCPLSPLLFIICYDILIYNIKKHAADLNIDINIFAFADDIALSAIDLAHFSSIMPVIDEFSHMSGLGLNADKTKFISSLPFTDYDRHVIDDCPWPLKINDCLVESHTYLGIIMGRDITTIDIYTPAYNKFNERVKLFSPYLTTCNIDKRITIFNVFLNPLFSYLTPMFIMPYDEIYIPVRNVVRKKIIPYAGGGFSYCHLLEKKTLFAFCSALVDLWAWSTAMLVAQSDLARQHGKQWCILEDMEHVHFADWGSLLIPEHVAHMTMHFLHNYGRHDEAGLIDASFYSDDIRVRRKQIYRMLVEKEYLADRLVDNKRTSSLVYKINKFPVADAKSTVTGILAHARYLPNYLPNHIWNFFVSLVYNTLPFDMRIRKALKLDPRSDDPDNPFPCKLLCGTGPDSSHHLFGTCPVMLEIKDRLQINGPRSEKEELQHSLLGFPDDDRRKEATTIVIALWACWCISRKGHFNNSAEATKAILARTKLTAGEYAERRQRLHDKRAAKAVLTKEKARESIQFVERKLASLSPTDTIIFTDGSGRAKFAGAGAFIDTPYAIPDDPTPNKAHVHMQIALGKGTNNLGELWAMGMALEFISLLLEMGRWEKGEVHIFSDSSYSIGGLNGTTTPKSNLDLFSAVKAKYHHLLALGVEIFLHWVKAHAGIDYNEKADELAGAANEDSEAGLGLDFTERTEAIAAADLMDPDKTVIEFIPIYPPDNG